MTDSVIQQKRKNKRIICWKRRISDEKWIESYFKNALFLNYITWKIFFIALIVYIRNSPYLQTNTVFHTNVQLRFSRGKDDLLHRIRHHHCPQKVILYLRVRITYGYVCACPVEQPQQVTYNSNSVESGIQICIRIRIYIYIWMNNDTITIKTFWISMNIYSTN